MKRGEALRFDEVSIRAGVKGIINVMRTLEMLPPSKRKSKSKIEPVVARSSSWIRAPESGIVRMMVPLGSRVKKDTLLGVVSDPLGEVEINIPSTVNGIVIGRSNLPLVNVGDALFHIARFEHVTDAANKVDDFQEEHSHEIISSPNSESPIS